MTLRRNTRDTLSSPEHDESKTSNQNHCVPEHQASL